MPKPVPIEELIALHEEKQRIAGAKEDKPIKRDYGEVTTYYLPRDEIERRYGRVGLFKERPRVHKTYGYPDMGQKNERHYAKGVTIKGRRSEG